MWISPETQNRLFSCFPRKLSLKIPDSISNYKLPSNQAQSNVSDFVTM